jgi:hypothetical protein
MENDWTTIFRNLQNRFRLQFLLKVYFLPSPNSKKASQTNKDRQVNKLVSINSDNNLTFVQQYIVLLINSDC